MQEMIVRQLRCDEEQRTKTEVFSRELHTFAPMITLVVVSATQRRERTRYPARRKEWCV